MKKLLEKVDHLVKILEPQVYLVEVMRDESLKELIVMLNTGGPNKSLPTSQLWNGIDSKGRRLEQIGGGNPITGTYSPLTIEAMKNVNGFSGKRERGLPFDRITLYNDGIFYNSWRVGTKKTGSDAEITIKVDPNRGDTNLFDDWGEDIVGLTDENLSIFRDKFLEKTLNFIRNELSRF